MHECTFLHRMNFYFIFFFLLLSLPPVTLTLGRFLIFLILFIFFSFSFFYYFYYHCYSLTLPLSLFFLVFFLIYMIFFSCKILICAKLTFRKKVSLCISDSSRKIVPYTKVTLRAYFTRTQKKYLLYRLFSYNELD